MEVTESEPQEADEALLLRTLALNSELGRARLSRRGAATEQALTSAEALVRELSESRDECAQRLDGCEGRAGPDQGKPRVPSRPCGEAIGTPREANVSPPVTLVAEPFDAELAGPARAAVEMAEPGGPAEGGFADGGPAEGGPAEGGPAEGGPAEGGPAEGGPPVVALGEFSAEGVTPAIRWLDRVARADDAGAGLLVAPAGEGLWRRAPWPAADGLFDLPEAPGAPALLVGAEAGLREAVAERAAARGVALTRAERLDAAALAAASCVILAESPGGALPARAFAVLAAGRLLIVPRLDTTFGLEDGLDHLEFADPDEAVTAVEAFAADPDAFGRIRVWGRLKAEPRRASVVYGRLAEDLRLHGLDAPA